MQRIGGLGLRIEARFACPYTRIRRTRLKTDMFIVNLQKYDPKNFGKGGYLLDEWISVSEIGTTFYGQQFTLDQYLDMEDRYIKCMLFLIDYFGQSSLIVSCDPFGIREYPDYRDYLFNLPKLIRLDYETGNVLKADEIETYLRLGLRGMPPFGLTNKRDFFIGISQDYYVHLGIKTLAEDLFEFVENQGLFLVPQHILRKGTPEFEDYSWACPEKVGNGDRNQI